MNFRELIEDNAKQNIKDWKAALKKTDYSKVAKYVLAYAKKSGMKSDSDYISDLGTALSTTAYNKAMNLTIYGGFDDGEEGLEPRNYTKDHGLPLMLQVEMEDENDQFIEVFTEARKAIDFIDEKLSEMITESSKVTFSNGEDGEPEVYLMVPKYGSVIVTKGSTEKSITLDLEDFKVKVDGSVKKLIDQALSAQKEK